MKITFIGTGEACDTDRRNTCILIQHDAGSMVLDCGFTAAQGLIGHNQVENIHAVWLSHGHGDHIFGIPQLLLHFLQSKRTRPLTIISASPMQDHIIQMLLIAYPNLLEKIDYPLRFLVVEPGQAITHNTLRLQTAESLHSGKAFSLRLDSGAISVYYSGDGRPTDAGKSLMQDCDLIVHEAHTLKNTDPGHCSLKQCCDIFREQQPELMALVHLNQMARRAPADEVVKQFAPRVFLPCDNQLIPLDQNQGKSTPEDSF